MGVSSVTNRVVVAGDGVSTSFSFPYYFFRQADLIVYKYDTIAGGITGPYVLNTDYTISGTPNYQGLYASGGTVVFSSYVPLITDIIIVIRSPIQQQNFALLQGGTISSSALVEQFDYVTLLIQRLQDEVSRCVQLADGDGASFSMQLPGNLSLFPGYFPIINPAGNGWILSDSAGIGGGGTVTSVALSLPVSLFSVSGSPVTGAGTLTGSLTTQTANLVFAGPTSGPAGAPTFRPLVAADLPAGSPVVVYNGGDANYAIPADAGYVRSGTVLTANRAYTLPPAVVVGQSITIKNLKSQTFNIVVFGNGVDTVETAASVTLNPGNSVQFTVGVSGQWDAN